MGIFFNDSAVVSTDTDTRVIEKGSLNETSPILEKYQEQYITYLNGLRDWRIAPPNPIVIPNPFK
ncbi:TPA: hypothetical protein DCZ39_08460 [Patescibacteria group bacterium]|nr:hypothetical protein [Candidatus Gracilibacteria bacterium]